MACFTQIEIGDRATNHCTHCGYAWCCSLICTHYGVKHFPSFSGIHPLPWTPTRDARGRRANPAGHGREAGRPPQLRPQVRGGRTPNRPPRTHPLVLGMRPGTGGFCRGLSEDAQENAACQAIAEVHSHRSSPLSLSAMLPRITTKSTKSI